MLVSSSKFSITQSVNRLPRLVVIIASFCVCSECKFVSVRNNEAADAELGPTTTKEDAFSGRHSVELLTHRSKIQDVRDGDAQILSTVYQQIINKLSTNNQQIINKISTTYQQFFAVSKNTQNLSTILKIGKQVF